MLQQIAVDERRDLGVWQMHFRRVAVDEVELCQEARDSVRTVTHAATSNHLGACLGKGSGGRAFRRITLQATKHDGSNVLRNAALAPGEDSQIGVADLKENVELALSLKQGFTNEHFRKNRGQREYIALPAEVFAEHLLR
jgi:hypothetical protein